MEKNKIIIGILIVIIIALLIGIVSLMPNLEKQDTMLSFKSNSTLTEGDSLKVKLTDVNGTPITNQTVNLTITDEDNVSDYYSVITDENGVGTLKLDKSSGKYNVVAKYDGDENYTGNKTTQKLTIKEKVTEPVKTYPKYNPDLGYYRSTGLGQDEWGVVELEDGRYVVIAGDGYYEYLGMGDDGYPITGNEI